MLGARAVDASNGDDAHGDSVMQIAAGSLDPQGPVARTIADLWWLMLWLGVAAFLVFAYFLAVGLARRRSSESPRAPPRGSDRWILWGGVAMPVVVLTVVLVATVSAMRDIPTTANPDALVVEIVGHQWWWEVHYPDADVTLRNELHIPVGRLVELRLTSADVIHSFWVPELSGKMDLLPERTNTLILQADQSGEHRSACAEYCGLHHADMVLNVVAEPPNAFTSWLEEQRAEGAA